MRANDEITAEHIESLEADNDALRVELELTKKELESWKKLALIMTADRDCTIPAANHLS
jgi:hypothetical protein